VRDVLWMAEDWGQWVPLILRGIWLCGLLFLAIPHAQDALLAQLHPVSTLSLSSKSELGGRPDSNPADLVGFNHGKRSFVFTEVPFGLIDIRATWFGGSFAAGNWTVAAEIATQGFDTLNQLSTEVSLARLVSKRVQLGLGLGALHSKRGKLSSSSDLFWHLGLVLPTPMRGSGTWPVDILAELQHEPLSESGFFSPTHFSLGARAALLTAVSLVSKITFSASRDMQTEVALCLQPVAALGIEVGYESSRSMLFGGISVRVSRIVSRFSLSRHYVLGLSSGLSVSLTY